MSGSGPRQAKILVVEDDRTAGDLFRRALAMEGYSVVVVRSGAPVLETARAEQPDLILLDIVIPAPSGFEVCVQLKGDPATRRIPIVFVSGLPELPNRRHGCELGAVDYLAKPFKMDRLAACVRKHLPPQSS